MEKELSIYVSASTEMDAECELLGQFLAGMPRSIRWTIKRTPRGYEHVNPDLSALRNSHFYLILLGMDIKAPIGVEWEAAREAHLAVLAFRKSKVIPSPAGAFFAHNTRISWQLYETPRDFVQKLERALVTRLIEGTPGYGLGIGDIEELAARLEALKEGPSQEESESEERRGAGRGGIILPSN